eukprot:TRINITY_DN4731_c3_g1_i1.p1 TRINITY_DN4731_c3_g1~~TRINITY_DN4731_c3_g1_i1.p1  ORF type:complete len:903 (-),score=181.67 TRINITY_DN4731_c3_g1_i1:298-2895(-)
MNTVPSIGADQRHFLVPWEWMCDCREYVQGTNQMRPGVIPTATLLEAEGGNLRRGLVQEADYALVHEALWRELKQRFGADGEIVRETIENPLLPGDYIVEVYQLPLRVIFQSKNVDEVMLFSKGLSLDKVAEKVVKALAVTQSDVEMSFINKDTKKPLFAYEDSIILGASRVEEMDILFVKEHGVNASNAPVSSVVDNTESKEQRLSPANVSVKKSKTDDDMDEFDASSESTDSKNENQSDSEEGENSETEETADPSQTNSNSKRLTDSYLWKVGFLPKGAGVVGLSNLGNTCFMNSGLQCLSNTVPLRNYFLTDRYKSEINRDNVLGTGGALATQFANLIRNMWLGHSSVVTPRDFKYTLGRHAPQFSGYQQHDSQELLTFLLDGIHEDLNRVKKKPYKEIQESSKPVQEVAQELWDYHTSRNSSIVVDIFHGQYKLKIMCDTCQTVSYACDPFMYLQVPIPSSLYLFVDVLVMLDSGVNTKYRIKIESTARVADLQVALAELSGLSQDDQCLVAVSPYQFKPLKATHIVHEVHDYRVTIACYEVKGYSRDDDEDEKDTITPVVVHPVSAKKDFYGAYPQIGLPVVFGVNKSTVTYESLARRIMKTYALHVSASGFDSSAQFELESLPFRLLNAKKGTYYGEDYTPLPLTDEIATITTKIMCVWNEKTSTDLKKIGKEMAIDLHESMKMNAPTKDECTLADCLDSFGRLQKLTGENRWNCPKCKAKRDATKKYGIHRYPNVLVIQLKRFISNGRYRDKIDTLVRFPIRGLKISNHNWEEDQVEESPIYDLHAISNHMGGLGGGHYTAYGLNSESQKWYSFNDSSTSLVSESQIVTSSAYVLFYHRRDPVDLQTDGRPGTHSSSA